MMSIDFTRMAGRGGMLKDCRLCSMLLLVLLLFQPDRRKGSKRKSVQNRRFATSIPLDKRELTGAQMQEREEEKTQRP